MTSNACPRALFNSGEQFFEISPPRSADLHVYFAFRNMNFLTASMPIR